VELFLIHGIICFCQFFIDSSKSGYPFKILVPLKLPGHKVTIQVTTINAEREEPSRYIVAVYLPDLKISDNTFVHHVSCRQVLSHLLGAHQGLRGLSQRGCQTEK